MYSLTVVQHNVLSWVSRKFDLSNTYRQLDADIILINSHGLRDDNRLKIPGYRTYQTNVANAVNDGVAIAVKSSIRHKVEDGFLSETLAIETDTNDGPILIATSYLPPRRPYLPHPDFLRLFRRQTPVIMAGDLNARHRALGSTTTNQVGRDLLGYLRHQTIRHIGPHFPTFYGHHSTTAPDIVLTNSSMYLNYHLSPGPFTTSDHTPIIINISTNPILIPKPSSYSFHRTDWETFKDDPDLQMTNLPDISTGTLEDIDDALTAWTHTIQTTADRHIPKTSYRLQPCPRPSRVTQLAKIQFAALKARATRIGWTYDHYRRYITLRQTLHDSRQVESREHWGRALAGLAANYSDPKTFWRKVKCLSGRTTGPETYLIDQNGNKKHSEEDKEQLFTPIWETVFREEDNDNIDDSVQNYMTDNILRTTPFDTADLTRLTGTTTLDCLISSRELTAALKSGRTTAPGSSKINRTILLNLPAPALDRLRAIFNATLSAGYFPDGFKGAVMTMVPKSGKVPTRPDSYRPISLLEVHGKTLERIVSRRIQDHLEWQNHLNEGQYGFRRGRGTTHAIAMATETLAVHHASGYRCNLVLRDVSKAFDKVWHLGLKYKILHLGLPGPIERVLCDFLEDRTARVKVGSHSGPAFPLNSGVPQGSVLSPLLFNIFTGDCPASTAGLNVQYADDVSQVVFHPGRSSAMLNARTGREVERVNAFEEKWRIRTNMTKFTAIPLSTRNPTPLLVNEELVDFSNRGSLLGLSVTGRGYTTNITKRVASARAALSKLYRFRDLDTKLKLHLIKAMVIPILTYPPIPTHAFSKNAISRLQKVQNAGLRFAFNTRWDDFTTSESLHEAASIPAINIRLHLMALKVWERMEAEGWEQFLALQEQSEGAPDKDHAWFPRSLRALQRDPNPEPRYR